jgi:Papain-like cysteine protease AvrRpt2
MRRSSLIQTLLLALIVAGCATRPTSDLNAFAQRSASNSFEPFEAPISSPSALVLPVVHDRQTTGASCGAHALASVVNYWRGAGTVTGDAIYTASPPANAEDGYSIAELVALAQQQGLLASGVRLNLPDLIRELEAGRPVLVPVRIPSIYVQNRTLPGSEAPVIGVAADVVVQRIGSVSEMTNLALVNHYLLLVGYDRDRAIVVEPVMGYRTISFERLARYRRDFDDAAIVFSASPPPSGSSTPAHPITARR